MFALVLVHTLSVPANVTTVIPATTKTSTRKDYHDEFSG